MKKNFIQRHMQIVAVILICFIVVPFIRNTYALPFEGILNLPSVAETKVISEKRVVLDAGHGGYDDGSVSANGLKEKDIALDIIHYAGAFLEDEGISVIYTRDSDQVSWSEDNVEDLLERSNITNASKAHLFVSVHMNDTIYGSEISGNEVWVQYDDEVAFSLASAIHEELQKVNYTESRGLKDEAESPLSLLQYNTIPSVLVEAGFMSNEQDIAYLSTEQGKKKVGIAIANGIIRALN